MLFIPRWSHAKNRVKYCLTMPLFICNPKQKGENNWLLSYCNPPGKSSIDCIWLATDNDLISLREKKKKKKLEQETKIDRIERRTRLISGDGILCDEGREKRCTKAINRRKDGTYHHALTRVCPTKRKTEADNTFLIQFFYDGRMGGGFLFSFF